MIEPAPPLLSEVLRPRKIRDLTTLPQHVIDRLQRMYDDCNIMNMLFYGKPGGGKTSAAHCFRERYDLMEVNGSTENGVDIVRTRIERFAGCYSMYNYFLEPGETPKRTTPKICFIDEADNLSDEAQGALRKIIEDYHENCRFIFAVNDIQTIMPAIQSRLMPIDFDIAPADRGKVHRRLLAWYAGVLSERGIEYDPQRLHEIVGKWFPDLRAINTQLEFALA
jgi:DNA polymerase III delta prime subunit